MKFKKIIKLLFTASILLNGLILATDFDKIFKKATLENSYQDKVEFAVSRLIDESLFDIQVLVSLEDNAEYEEYLTIQSKSSFEEMEEEVVVTEELIVQSSPGLLPGLPSIPTAAVDEKGMAVDTRKELKEETKFDKIPSEYTIERIEVSVRLDESVSSPNIKQEITTTIRSVIPGIENCFDCVDYEVKNFIIQKLSNQLNKYSEDQNLLKEQISNQFNEIKSSSSGLKDNIESKFDDYNLQNENNKLDLEDRFNELSISRSQEIIDLQLSLEESLNQIANEVREKLEADMSLRDKKSHINDSTMWVEFIKRENEYQKRQDDMMLELTQKRLETEEKYAQDILKFAEEQLERVMNKDDSDMINPAYDRADLGMQKLGTKSILEHLPWAVAILMTLLLGIAILKRPKPIYLKPKYVEPAPVAQKKNQPLMVEKQEFDEDNDVIRNEVKNIRQAAVAESIREKKGAVNIISNWLDDENEVTNEKKQTSDSKADSKKTDDKNSNKKKKK